MKFKLRIFVIFIILAVFLKLNGERLLSREEIPNNFLERGVMDYFPCSDCHRKKTPNPAKRKLLKEHTDIQLNHAVKNIWCVDCHNLANRDKLRLINGELIPFSKSFLLCGQCHGTIYRDWKVGVHGKRTGFWNGEKVYRLCVHCHNPHSPGFKPIKPKSPPLKPNDIKWQ